LSDARPFKALVVGFVESIHAVRAVAPMLELGWEVHVFASHPHWATPAWRDVTLHVDPGFDPPEPHESVTVEYLAPPPGDTEPVVEGLSWKQRPRALAAAIEALEPDLVDSMEIQHGGYVMLDALAHLQGPPPPWLVHNWGSDLYYYGRNPRHVERLRGIFRHGDLYGAECHRDVGLARAFGFAGKSLPVLPNTGGIELERVRALRRAGATSTRTTVALKAADTFVYRPGTALDAIELCAEEMRGKTLALYTATAEIEERAEELGARLGFEVEVASRATALVPHDEILELHGRCRASISLSRSDAICTSFLEAMTMGSFPIQSDTGCAQAWTEPGTGALFVDPEDVEGVAEALRRALTDDALVDAAAAANAAVVEGRLDDRLVKQRMVDGYRRVAAEVRGAPAAEGLDPVAMAAALEGAEREPGDCPVAAQRRRERLALLYLEPAADVPLASELLEPGAGAEELELLVADLHWLVERQAEQIAGEQVGWAAGRVAAGEAIEEHYDSELIERDAHIQSLRHHVGAMQGSLEGLHQQLEAATAPAAPPPTPATRVRAKLGRVRRGVGRRVRATLGGRGR
jgi:glycosyltransferase involved in cell wall biosynthesis